ncbi:MAG TPA: IclR family transcriptional regulator [Anaerolineales bacterium]|nr:IclR family transcriptional regulator [Anaerolineales bacterium]
MYPEISTLTPEDSQSHPYGGTQAVSRAIRLLSIFTDSRPELAISELVKASGLNRTTVYRLLAELQQAGLVAYNPNTEQYRLGPELIVLGARAVRANPLRSVSRPMLQWLAEQSGEMASLEQLENASTLIVDEIKGHHQKKLNTSIGNIWPAYATSTGKVLLAELSESQLCQLLPEQLPPLTHFTISTRSALLAELAKVAKQGFALARNELEDGLTEIAAPVRNHQGLAVAAISLGGPSARLTTEQLTTLQTMLLHAAGNISRQLGFR